MKRMLSKNLEAIFLDFDGVVVESATIKTQAFYDLYLPYGVDAANYAKMYHLINQGISRYKKFESIHRDFLKKSCSEIEKKILSRNFANIVFKKIINCEFVEGIIGFLEKMKINNIPIFLLSATPHDELKNIVHERGINHYFKGIYGAPHEKSETGSKIIFDFNFNKKNIIFIGDSLSDFDASNIIGSSFIGRVPREAENPFPSSIKIICNFKEII